MENDLADYQKALYKRVNIRGAPLCFQRSEQDIQQNTIWNCCCCPNWCKSKPTPSPMPPKPTPSPYNPSPMPPRPYNPRSLARAGRFVNRNN